MRSLLLALVFGCGPAPEECEPFELGTPAITSRGMAEPEVNQLAAMLIEVLADIEDKKAHAKVSAQVKELTARFAVPGIDS